MSQRITTKNHTRIACMFFSLQLRRVFGADEKTGLHAGRRMAGIGRATDLYPARVRDLHAAPARGNAENENRQRNGKVHDCRAYIITNECKTLYY